jgi:hypothetical protein
MTIRVHKTTLQNEAHLVPKKCVGMAGLTEGMVQIFAVYGRSASRDLRFPQQVM